MVFKQTLLHSQAINAMGTDIYYSQMVTLSRQGQAGKVFEVQHDCNSIWGSGILPFFFFSHSSLKAHCQELQADLCPWAGEKSLWGWTFQ